MGATMSYKDFTQIEKPPKPAPRRVSEYEQRMAKARQKIEIKEENLHLGNSFEYNFNEIFKGVKA